MHNRILSLATKQETTSLVDFDYSCHIALLDTKFLLCSHLCSYRAGTREVHNKLEKNRWVQPVYHRAALKREKHLLFVFLRYLSPVILMSTLIFFQSRTQKLLSKIKLRVAPPVLLSYVPSLCLVSVRRAHLKECFETLKKNIPNIDEKKTSNLSVLRSALRYIQVCCCCCYH